jgi:hypothetical protein
MVRTTEIEDLRRHAGMHRSVAEAVSTMLEKLLLDDAGQSRAAIAMALARSLDAAQSSQTGTVAQAIPSMAKELRATIQEIQEGLIADDPLLLRLNKEDE